MFRGINSVSLDAKGRMALPTSCRQTLQSRADGRVVTTIHPGGDPCLLVYPLPEWDAVQAQLATVSNLPAAMRRLRRALIGHATDGQLDANGRLLLPAMLREHAGLKKKLVLLGDDNKIEVWSEAEFQEDRGEWQGQDLASETTALGFEISY